MFELYREEYNERMSLESLSTNSENIHQTLKELFLKGEITPKDFQDKLMELDQSTPDRSHSKENLALLTDPQIVQFIEDQPEEVQKGYYQMLSFTEFHIGQAKALYEDKPEEALEYFEKSLEHDYKGYAFSENVSYKKAVIAYFNNDAESLEEYIDLDTRGNNPKILANMLKGLRERGSPNYKEDYRV
jgi:hypothetical protein